MYFQAIPYRGQKFKTKTRFWSKTYFKNRPILTVRQKFGQKNDSVLTYDPRGPWRWCWSRIDGQIDPFTTEKHRMKWLPLSRIFLGPSSLFYTEHVYCFLKKPWCLINSKVELSSFFWKHRPRGVVRLTDCHHFETEFKFWNWSVYSY